MTIITALSAFSIRRLGNESSDQILYLLCRNGERNLDMYFDSIEQSVKTVSAYAEKDLAATDLSKLNEHLERVEDVFEKIAGNTAGILTYYYRIDPTVSTDDKGFWFISDGNIFYEHEVTDITLYDTSDQSALVWFTVPKATGNPVWLPPYITENLDEYVLSYNVPIYKNNLFIGVIGIEIDYDTMAETVKNISLYENGYAFINDDEGNIIYHPYISIEELQANHPKVPEGLLSEDTFVTYNFDGVEKQAVWMKMDNGMRLNVTVPISEINSNWHNLISEIIFISLLLLTAAIIVAIRFAKQIIDPLHKLTETVEQVDTGNYDLNLEYDKDDEVGILTRSFNHLIDHLKIYIGELNSLAYADALTSVHNKGAFDISCREMDEEINNNGKDLEFAIGVFDCDDLKSINDSYGHEKGDIYLKKASQLICDVFAHSPVFRTGGDEFAVILQGDDYNNRSKLLRSFKKKCKDSIAAAENDWDKVSVAIGIADYDPDEDRSANSVIRRADILMYEDKNKRKKKA